MPATELIKAGISNSLIVILVSVNVAGVDSKAAFLTTTYSLSFKVTLIGFWSSTLTVRLYVFWSPFWAVTTREKTLVPSVTSSSPSPFTEALESFTVAF